MTEPANWLHNERVLISIHATGIRQFTTKDKYLLDLSFFCVHVLKRNWCWTDGKPHLSRLWSTGSGNAIIHSLNFYNRCSQSCRSCGWWRGRFFPAQKVDCLRAWMTSIFTFPTCVNHAEHVPDMLEPCWSLTLSLLWTFLCSDQHKKCNKCVQQQCEHHY